VNITREQVEAYLACACNDSSAVDNCTKCAAYVENAECSCDERAAGSIRATMCRLMSTVKRQEAPHE
jgi:hypothetical protein